MAEINSIACFVPKHLPQENNQAEIAERLALLEFVEVYVRDYYFRDVVDESKMDDLESYISFKNNEFQVKIHEFRKRLQEMQQA